MQKIWQLPELLGTEVILEVIPEGSGRAGKEKGPEIGSKRVLMGWPRVSSRVTRC